jgi:hypothetical protein
VLLPQGKSSFGASDISFPSNIKSRINAPETPSLVKVSFQVLLPATFLSSIKEYGGSLACLVFNPSRFIHYRCFGEYSTGEKQWKRGQFSVSHLERTKKHIKAAQRHPPSQTLPT